MIVAAATPRAIRWAAKELGDAYAGAVVDGWIAPALDQANPSPLPWTQEDLFSFLRTGASPLHGAIGGTMVPVIRDALALAVVPDSDVRAIAVYFADMDQLAARASGVDAMVVKRSRLPILPSASRTTPTRTFIPPPA